LSKVRCKRCGLPLTYLTAHRCSYCGEWVCVDHRLPELHDCSWTLGPPTPPVKVGGTGGLMRKPSWKRLILGLISGPGRVRGLSRMEVRDILVSMLVLSAAFTIALGYRSLWGFTLSLIGVGVAFMFHELAHRYVARSLGCWAEYRMWPMGLAMALAFSLLGFVFAAPGAVYIAGPLTDRKAYGLIAAVGPLVNVILSSAFLSLLWIPSLPAFLLALSRIGFRINAWLAFFNLLPLPPLDGSKVVAWGLKQWALLMMASLTLLAAPYLM